MLEMLAMQRAEERRKQEVADCEKRANVVLKDKIDDAKDAYATNHRACMMEKLALTFIGLDPVGWCVNHEYTRNATIQAAERNHAIKTLACNKPK